MPDEVELGRLLRDAAESPESMLLHAEQHHLLHQASCISPSNCALFLYFMTWRS